MPVAFIRLPVTVVVITPASGVQVHVPPVGEARALPPEPTQVAVSKSIDSVGGGVGDGTTATVIVSGIL